ncbi:NAD(P)-dependent oxidoreductase [Bradyrhizobium yuanmingense]|uniref:NAD-dependent epimerase/dehydratase family protein n=1 Tax=Bradyrhizobium yuanmingense TaxID=108015 RepID=UPI0021A78DFA|nr:NAD(P)-dependent oxidoreductase [Bradyrhizobium sp. CB1024]UWU83208.1 NAD(P)-dependent oxidoreductase [Bradyrhizobium sp. CB1024]
MSSPAILCNLERFAGKSVLVTGSSGFIGRRLVSLLVAHRAKVMLLQRRAEPTSRDILLANLAEPDFDAQIASVWGERHFDTVFNLAAYGVTRSTDSSADGQRRKRLLAQRVNVDAARAIFRHAQKTGSSSFVQAGTCFEYAPLDDAPRVETDPLERRDNLDSVIYGVSKARATDTLLRLAQSSTLSLVVARIFNVYGPGEKSERLLPSLVYNLSHGKRVPLSAGMQIKDYLHLDDVVEGLCMLALTAGNREFRGVLNLSSGFPVSVAQFARVVADTIGHCEHLLSFGERPAHPEEVPVLIGSTAARDAFTEWRPRLPLDVGVPSVVCNMMAKDCLRGINDERRRPFYA